MLKRLLLSTLILVGLPLTARAGSDDDDAAVTQARSAAGSGINEFAGYIRDMHDFGTTTPNASTAREPSKCFDVIDKYKGTLKADDQLRNTNFKYVDGSTQDPDSSQYYLLPFGKAKAVCQTYADLRTTILAAAPLEKYYGKLGDDAIRQSSVESLDWYLIVTDPTYLEKLGSASGKDKGETCGEAIDKALAAGAKGDVAIKFGRKVDLTLEDLRARCEAAGGGGDAFKEKARVWAQEKYDSVAKPLKAAGIKGKRLELFIYYNGGWYLPGCTSTADSPKQLKKAKKLFRWLTDGDGIITIQKFTFKGDTYKQSDKRFLLESKAYKGCK